MDEPNNKERARKRTGALVFCISCGAYGVTLRKWHNSYICTDCMREHDRIGEEAFRKKVDAQYNKEVNELVVSVQESDSQVSDLERVDELLDIQPVLEADDISEV